MRNILEVRESYSQKLIQTLDYSKAKCNTMVDLITMQELTISLNKLEASILESINNFFHYTLAFVRTKTPESTTSEDKVYLSKRDDAYNMEGEACDREETARGFYEKTRSLFEEPFGSQGRTALPESKNNGKSSSYDASSDKEDDDVSKPSP